MATSDTELEIEVRDFTDIDTSIVGTTEFETVLSDSKRHIKLERSLRESELDWYGEEAQEDALNWTTKLFLKVAAGQLDSQAVQVGAIDHNTLLAKDDDEVTVWFRKMQRAMNRLNPEASFGIASPARREYGTEDDDASSGLSL